MSNPDWFVLIEQWLKKGMGAYGVTLPFLVGALVYKNGEKHCEVSHVRKLLDQIINNPVQGYVTEARWCGNIDAPVFSVREIDSPYHQITVQSSFACPDGSGISLGFSQSLQTTFGGLDCQNASECYEKLVTYTEDHIVNGHYSRKRSGNEFLYGPFDEKDLKFIRETIMLEI